MKASRGFTLIEMVVVLAVIAILAAVLTPIINSYVDRARINSANSDVKNIAAAILQYNTDTKVWPIYKTNADIPNGNAYDVASTPGDTPSLAGSATGWTSGILSGTTSLDLLVNSNFLALPTTGTRAWKGAYLQIGSDAGQCQCRCDVDISGKPAGGFAGSAGKDQPGLGQSNNIDAVGDEIRRTRQAARRFSRYHPDAGDAAFGRGDDSVEPYQSAGGNDDAAAMLARQIHKIEIVEQGAAAQYHHGAPMRERRLCELTQYCGRRAFHDHIAKLPQLGERNDRHFTRKAFHYRFRPRYIARRDGRKDQPLDSFVEAPGNDLPDRAKSADRNTQCHRSSFSSLEDSRYFLRFSQLGFEGPLLLNRSADVRERQPGGNSVPTILPFSRD